MMDIRRRRVLTIVGSTDSGTQELTRQYHQALNVDYQASSWPQTTDEWIAEQRKDPILQVQWQLLQEGGKIRRFYR